MEGNYEAGATFHSECAFSLLRDIDSGWRQNHDRVTILHGQRLLLVTEAVQAAVSSSD